MNEMPLEPTRDCNWWTYKDHDYGVKKTAFHDYYRDLAAYRASRIEQLERRLGEAMALLETMKQHLGEGHPLLARLDALRTGESDV